MIKTDVVITIIALTGILLRVQRSSKEISGIEKQFANYNNGCNK